MGLSEEQVARQALAIRLKQQLSELSREIKKWQGRVETSRTQGRPELADAAAERVEALSTEGRRLWAQLNELTVADRFLRLEVDLELQELKKQMQLDDTPAAEYEEIDEELEKLKKARSSDEPDAPA